MSDVRANHHENCGIHHSVCLDPEKCLLMKERDSLRSLARRLAEALQHTTQPPHECDSIKSSRILCSLRDVALQAARKAGVIE